MISRRLLTALTVATTIATPWTAWSDPALPIFTRDDLVPLIHGPNWVDLDGDGVPDLVMKSRFEINGPHSASVYSFHRRFNESTDDRIIKWPPWEVVPIIDDSDTRHPHGKEDVFTYEGADCILTDLRLLKKTGTTYIVIASRDIGDGFWDNRIFTFNVYQLIKEADQQQNYVAVAFHLIGKFPSKQTYCGANEAFLEEMGIPNPEADHDDRR